MAFPRPFVAPSQTLSFQKELFRHALRNCGMKRAYGFGENVDLSSYWPKGLAFILTTGVEQIETVKAIRFYNCL